MNIEGLTKERKSESVTIESLKRRLKAYRESPSIYLYIDEVLDEQKKNYGYVSKEVKLKKKFDIENEV